MGEDDMYFKLLGGLLLISSSSLLGLALSNKVSGRPRELKRFRMLMQMLETEVIYRASPLPAAFKNISNIAEEGFAQFFEFISDGLTSRRFFTLRDAWTAGADEILAANTSLGKADIELIRNFGTVLGYSDREDQKKHFELFYVQLKHYEDMAEEERKKSSRMYRSLGFLFGAAVFIILA